MDHTGDFGLAKRLNAEDLASSVLYKCLISLIYLIFFIIFYFIYDKINEIYNEIEVKYLNDLNYLFNFFR